MFARAATLLGFADLVRRASELARALLIILIVSTREDNRIILFSPNLN